MNWRTLLPRRKSAEQTIATKRRTGYAPKAACSPKHGPARRVLATQQRSQLVREIVSAAKVYQGGASELLQLTLTKS